MSGGSFNYGYTVLRDLYQECMEDAEMNDLVIDLTGILKDLEWWKSSDTDEETYRKSVLEFKEKWFKKSREERLKEYIDGSLSKIRSDLYEMIGVSK